MRQHGHDAEAPGAPPVRGEQGRQRERDLRIEGQSAGDEVPVEVQRRSKSGDEGLGRRHQFQRQQLQHHRLHAKVGYGLRDADLRRVQFSRQANQTLQLSNHFRQ